MAKLTLNDLANLQNENTAVSTINANNNATEAALENTLSRDGTGPNAMGANFDMNSNRIINLPKPVRSDEPLRLQDLVEFNSGGVVSVLPPGGSTGSVLVKTSNSDYLVGWAPLTSQISAGTNITITGALPSVIATSANPVFTTVNGLTISSSTGTLTVNSGKALVTNASLTLNGPDGTLTFQGTDTYVGRLSTDTLQNKTLLNPVLSGTASGNSTIPGAMLVDTSVTPGSYTNANLTVDSKGRVTSVANGSSGGGITVATIAALKALSPPGAGTYIDVISYATVGDLGGGRFVATTSSPGADNGGTIIWSTTPGTYYVRVYGGDVQADWFGVRSVLNPQAQLRSAFATAAALGKQCILPPVTLDILCDLSKTPLGVLRYYAFDIISNLRVVGTPGLSVLRIASGQSSNGAPKDLNHFLLDGAASDVYISGVVFDSNGQNNLQNGGLSSNSPINITGNSAQVTRLLIEDCQFNNCAGTNNIVLGQNTNGTAGTLSRDCLIRNCSFTANGLDTPDFTAVYMWAERAMVDNCRFFQPDAQSRTGKNWVAVELHGADNWFTNSEVINYYRACWCSSNFTRPATGQWVTDNRFNVWGFGPSVFRELSSLTVVNEVFIERNSILLRADYNTYSGSDMAGVISNTLYSVFNIYARHNSINVTGATNNVTYGCLVGMGTSGQSLDHFYWEQNFVSAAVNGFYARVNNGNGTLNEIHDRYNTYNNLGILNGTPTSFGSLFYQAGTSTFNRFSCIGNRYLGDGTNFDNAIYTQGTISVGIIEGNYMAGIPGAGQLNLTATISAAFGLQLCPTSGSSTVRTSLPFASKDRGFCFYDTTLSKVCMWSGSAWLT